MDQPVVIPTHADFNYYLPRSSDHAGPSTNDLELILGCKDQDTRRLPIHDIRGQQEKYTLDRNGFCIVNHADVGTEFGSDESIHANYYPKTETLLKRQFPASRRVSLLPFVIRGALRKTTFTGPTDPAWNKPDRGQAPAPRVHIDFTHRGVHLVLVQAFGLEEALRVTESGRRFIVLSIWRPLKLVRRDPLGTMDGSTVEDHDLVPLKRVYPDGKEGENILVKAGDGECRHKWYWMSGQKPDEVLVIKIYDSEAKEGRVTRTPHASFAVEGTESEAPRESIEIRAIVCF